MQLSDKQKEVINRLQGGGFLIKLSHEIFFGGGSGDRVNMNTFNSLEKKKLLGWDGRLTPHGKSIEL